MNPFQVVKDFERALCQYTGAPYAVTVTSCTMALLLACAWHRSQIKPDAHGVTSIPRLEIPKRTYVGVPMSIRHAGFAVKFRDEQWRGLYRLDPLPVWDSARYFNSGMYMQDVLTNRGAMMCVSFHTAKILGDTQGGAILHDNYEADLWLRRARFDGRTEGVPPSMDTFPQLGWHCYLSPDVASRLLWKMSHLPKHNEPLPNDEYPDLSQLEIFR